MRKPPTTTPARSTPNSSPSARSERARPQIEAYPLPPRPHQPLYIKLTDSLGYAPPVVDGREPPRAGARLQLVRRYLSQFTLNLPIAVVFLKAESPRQQAIASPKFYSTNRSDCIPDELLGVRTRGRGVSEHRSVTEARCPIIRITRSYSTFVE